MKKIILLMLTPGVLVLGMINNVFAAEQKTKEEELVFLGELPELPKDIIKYIITFIVDEKDFIKAAKNAEAFSRTNKEYKTFVIEKLKNRFKEPQKAQAELFKLIENGQLTLFALAVLKAAGANLDMRNEVGNTPLTRAVGSGRTKIVPMLINQGADLNKQDNDGDTALIIAIRYNPEIAKILIKEGADLNKQGIDGATALIVATQKGNTDLAKALIEKDANLNIQGKKFGDTALMAAVINKRAEIAKMLIKKGADLNKQAINSDTALMLAVQEGHTEIAKALIENGANLNIQNRYGVTALMYAVMDKRTKIVKALIDNNARLDMKNEHGKTALDIAKDFGLKKIVTLLEEAIEKEKRKQK